MEVGGAEQWAVLVSLWADLGLLDLTYSPDICLVNKGTVV